MPRGGPRPNAGRKPGSKSRATLLAHKLGPAKPSIAAIATKAAEAGITPADVLNAAMEFHFTRFRDTPVAEPEVRALHLARAHQAAKDLMPYWHPKMQPIEAKAAEADAMHDDPLAGMTNRDMARRFLHMLNRGLNDPDGKAGG